MAVTTTDQLGVLDAVLFGWFAGPHKDRGMERFPLMASPLPMLVLVGAYVLCTVFARRLAPKTPIAVPVSVVVAYNAFLVVLSAFMGLGMIVEGFFVLRVVPPCGPYDFAGRTLRLRFFVWCYYFSKFIEFGDTLLMVLRHKWDQISLLHVYHHMSMPVLWYLAGNWIGPGPTFVGPMINCFVHVVMYAYYGLAALGIEVHWKRYITQMQLVQFVVVFFYDLYIAFAGPQCCVGVAGNICARMHLLCAGYMVSLVLFFGHFYVNSYRSKARQRYPNNNQQHQKAKTT
jgi:hypothetical protein